jgi:putative nucleotidyltransferase with HDIG domain
MDNNGMILARKSQLKFYRDIALYSKGEDSKFVLYKPAGVTMREMRVEEDRIPGDLYIKAEEKIKGLQEAQKGFNLELASNIKSGEPAEVKETLVTLIEETLAEPRSGSLEGVSGTIDVMMSDYAQESDIIKQLLYVSSTDYSTIMHSINVMAFALAFASHVNMSRSKTKILGISALLHDVGKTKINQEVLQAPRKLTDEEFAEIKRHTAIGYDILRNCKFNDKNISLAALEHHEKLDGSGYPNGNNRISEIAQIIGIIDCYEALTNNDRPYRSAMVPIETLELLVKDVQAGKFNKDIFQQFAYSLVGK